jgi:hypothetical protein
MRHLRYLQESISAAICFQTLSVSVSSHWSVSYLNYKKCIKPKNAFLSSRKCLNASFYEDYSGAKTYYESCNSPRRVNGRTSNRTVDLFISHSLHYSSWAGSRKSAGLTDSALLIHCSAKNFLNVRHVLTITVLWIKIYRPGKDHAVLKFSVICLE